MVFYIRGGYGSGVDSGRILRFFFGPGAGVKHLWKNGSGPGVSFHFQEQESVWFSYMAFISKNVAEFRLHHWQSESEQELDSRIWKFFGNNLGPSLGPRKLKFASGFGAVSIEVACEEDRRGMQNCCFPQM